MADGEREKIVGRREVDVDCFVRHRRDE